MFQYNGIGRDEHMAMMGGLILSFHTSLADGGHSRGTNTAPTSQWYDLSGHGNHGNLSGFSYDMESGWTGKNLLADPYALYFNGSSNYVDAGSCSPSSNNMTFEIWFYYVDGHVILSNGGQGDQQGIAVLFNDSKELEVHYKTETTSSTINLGVKDRMKWHYVAGTYDAKTNYLQVYYNGAPAGRKMAVLEGSLNSPTNLIIGKKNNQDIGFFRGAIALVRLYDRALSMDEVGQNYLEGYLISNGQGTLLSRIELLERNDLSSALRVGTNSKAASRYDLIAIGLEGLHSTLRVTKFHDLKSGIMIGPSFAAKGRYNVVPRGIVNLPSALSINQKHDMNGAIRINSNVFVSGSYRIETQVVSEMSSNLKVNQSPARRSNYPGHIVINTVGKIISRYHIYPFLKNDLEAAMQIKNHSSLNGEIIVPTSGVMNARYNVSGLYADDFICSMNITSISQLRSSIQVSTTGWARSKYAVVSGDIRDLEAQLTITSTSDVRSNVKVSTLSWTRARYNMMATEEDFLPSSLWVREKDDLVSELLVNFQGYVRAKYNITRLSSVDVAACITVKEISDLTSIARISPYTSLRSRYNVIEPPTYTKILYSNKDAFVRESIPRLNYGQEGQMLAGYSQVEDGRFRSYVGFDIENADIPDTNTTIQRAILKVYLDSLTSISREVQVIEPIAPWTELGITWASQPYPHYFESPTSSYNGINVIKEMGGSPGYVEFDVTDSIVKWHQKEGEFFGFIMKAFDEDDHHTFIFTTKEQRVYRPQLEVSYYDTRIYSIGRDSSLGKLTIRRSSDSYIKSSMYIQSYQGSDVRNSRIFVENPRDMFSHILVSRKNTVGDIAVRYSTCDCKESLVTVRKKAEPPPEIMGSILIHKPDVPTSIKVPMRIDICSVLSVRRWGNPQPTLIADIMVIRKSTVGEIEVRTEADSLLEAQLLVGVPKLPGSIEIREQVILDGSISIKSPGKHQIPIVGYLRHHDNVVGKVTVHKSYVEGNLEVFHTGELISSIVARSEDGWPLISKMNIPNRADLKSTVVITPKTDTPSSINILSGYWSGQLAVPYISKNDRKSTLSVKVRAVSDLESQYGVRSGWLNSSLDVMVWGSESRKSQIIIAVSDDDLKPCSLVIRAFGRDVREGYIKARKTREADLHQSFKIRREDEACYECEINVRVLKSYLKQSGITIRACDSNNKISTITIRHSGDVEVPSSINVKQHDNLISTIAARVRIDKDGLESYISIWEKSSLENTLTVRQSKDDEDVPAHISVWEKNVLRSSIVLQFKKELESTIIAKQHYSLKSTIEVLADNDYCFIM